MKKEFTQYMIDRIARWEDTVYKGIMLYDWPKIKVKHENTDLGINVPEDIRIGLLSIHPNQYKEIITSKELVEWLGDSSIEELLTGTSNYNYTIEEGQNLVRWYIMNYWSFMNK